jgi:hypothetical protein
MMLVVLAELSRGEWRKAERRKGRPRVGGRTGGTDREKKSKERKAHILCTICLPRLVLLLSDVNTSASISTSPAYQRKQGRGDEQKEG